MVNNRWQTFRLGDLGTLRNGLNFSRDHEGVGLPILKVKDFVSDTLVDARHLDELNSDSIRVPADQFLMPGDTIIIRSNGNLALVGRSLFFRGASRPVAFSGFCIRF